MRAKPQGRVLKEGRGGRGWSLGTSTLFARCFIIGWWKRGPVSYWLSLSCVLFCQWPTVRIACLRSH